MTEEKAKEDVGSNPTAGVNPSANPLDNLKGKIADVSSERRWAMSCYIPIVNLLTCVLASVKMVNSKLCRFHARQGMVVFALWAAATLIGFISPTLSLMLLGIFLALCIAGMVIAYQGNETRLPILGQFIDKIPEYYVFKLLTGKIPEQISEDGSVKIEKKNSSVEKEDSK
jgi:uncharacterized membrane protein